MRNRREPRDYDEARWRERGEQTSPEYDEYGLHGEDRREYRGRESYEQQSRGGQGGRSGVWDHRFLPREYGAGQRTHEREDRQGYQNLGQRSEFESSYRGRPAFNREAGYRGADDYSRYGRGRPEFGDARDDDYSRSDYGTRYARGEPGSERHGSHFDEYEYGGRDTRPRDGDYGGSYARLATNRPGPDRHGRAYGGEWSRDSEGSGYRSGGPHYEPSHGAGPRYDQGRYLSHEYGRQFSDPWNQQRRPAQGPKGYKRSDERIREDVCDRLSHRWDLDASEIEVTVSNGEVTLAGSIQDRLQKHRAENVADSVSGVHEVHNQLRVKREPASQSEREQSAQSGGSSTRNASHNRSS